MQKEFILRKNSNTNHRGRIKSLEICQKFLIFFIGQKLQIPRFGSILFIIPHSNPPNQQSLRSWPDLIHNLRVP